MNYTLQQLIEKGFITKVKQRNTNDSLRITLRTNFPTLENICITVINNKTVGYAVSALNKILETLGDFKEGEYNEEDEENEDYNDDEENEDYNDDEENEDYEADEDLTESLRITRGH